MLAVIAVLASFSVKRNLDETGNLDSHGHTSRVMRALPMRILNRRAESEESLHSLGGDSFQIHEVGSSGEVARGVGMPINYEMYVSESPVELESPEGQ